MICDLCVFLCVFVCAQVLCVKFTHKHTHIFLYTAALKMSTTRWYLRMLIQVGLVDCLKDLSDGKPQNIIERFEQYARLEHCPEWFALQLDCIRKGETYLCKEVFLGQYLDVISSI